MNVIFSDMFYKLYVNSKNYNPFKNEIELKIEPL